MSKRKALSSLGTDMVEIYIGKAAQRYILHKELLCQISPYFDAMFNGGFGESSSQTCTLVLEEPQIFDIFVRCVYAGAVAENIPNAVGYVNTTTFEQIVKFYLMADRFMLSTDIKQQIMIAAIRTKTSVGSGKKVFFLSQAESPSMLHSMELNFAFKSLSDGDPFLEMAVDLACYAYHNEESCDDEWLENCLSNVPMSVFIRICRTLKDNREYCKSSEAHRVLTNAALDVIDYVFAPSYLSIGA